MTQVARAVRGYKYEQGNRYMRNFPDSTDLLDSPMVLDFGSLRGSNGDKVSRMNRRKKLGVLTSFHLFVYLALVASEPDGGRTAYRWVDTSNLNRVV